MHNRTVKYGYRFGEVPLPEVSPPKQGVNFAVRDCSLESKRVVVETSLGPHVEGSANPHGDPNHVGNVVRSVAKRVGCKPPQYNAYLRRRFRRFVGRWIRDNVVPLDAGYIFDPAVWIEQTSYPGARKRKLREVLDDINCRPEHDRWAPPSVMVKCFVKDESYATYKHVRGIYARVDEFKIRVGEFFTQLESQLYKHPQFIKHVPVSDRARYVFERLHSEGSTYIATDYTAFEAHFTRELFEDCEFQLYRYFGCQNAVARDVAEYYCKVAGGINDCRFKRLRVRIPACRMSGEMCTSLGNGFTNLMVFLFLAEVFRFDGADCVVEGDDCLARIGRSEFEACGARHANPGASEIDCKFAGTTCPTAILRRAGISVRNDGDGVGRVYPLIDIMGSFYTAMGFNIKLEVHDSIGRASFCSMVFDPSSFVVVPAPMKKILNIGWAHRKFDLASTKTKRELLRGKAMSLMAESRGAPVLQELALALLRLTKGYHFMIPDSWESQKLKDASMEPIAVPFDARVVMEESFGVTVPEQVALEAYFRQLTSIGPLRHPILIDHSNADQLHYAEHYVREYDGHHPSFELPSGILSEEYSIPRLIHAKEKGQASR